MCRRQVSPGGPFYRGRSNTHLSPAAGHSTVFSPSLPPTLLLSPFLPPSSFFFLPGPTPPSLSSPSSLPSLINHLPVGRNFFLPGAGGHLVPLSLTCRGTVGSKGVGARVPNMSLSPSGTSFYCICIPIGVVFYRVCSSCGLR